MILLNAENLSKGYSDRQLLDGCSLAVNEGDKIGLIGVNGTGKSTLADGELLSVVIIF